VSVFRDVLRDEMLIWSVDRRGNKVLLGITVFNVFLFVAVKFYYIGRNKRRQEVWRRMNEGEHIDYIYNTEDEGTKRLDFRFAH
jgi:hypothetical protein